MTLLWCFLLSLALNQVQAQYHQTDYGVKLERLGVTYYSHEYFNKLEANLAWYNRTQRVINASGYLLKDLKQDLKLDIQVYKFLSNEYRFFPITISGDICDGLRKNLFGLGNFVKNFSNINHCPPEAKFLYLRNAVVDFSVFPPYIPGGQYKLSAKWFYKSDEIMNIDFYGSVTTFITKWET